MGIGTIIAVGAVAAITSWVFGWTPTPWVTPKDFQDFNAKYMQVHDAQNAIHLEQLTETKRQTKILALTRCDAIKNIPERRQCFREGSE